MELLFDNIELIITAVVAVVAIILIFYFRTRAETENITEANNPFAGIDAGIEYTWEIRPNIVIRLMILLFILGIGAWLWFNSSFVRDLSDNFSQMWFVGIWFIGILFGGTSKAYRYAMTSTGIVRKDLSSKKKDNKPELLFTWENLSWFKPTNDGFRYYLKNSRVAPKTAVDAFKLITKASGYVKVGDDAALVNSLIMARGVSRFPPTESSSGDENNKSFKAPKSWSQSE